MTVARHLASAASAVEAALEAAVVAIHGEQNDRQESDLENDLGCGLHLDRRLVAPCYPPPLRGAGVGVHC
jgi:hypothetical protein